MQRLTDNLARSATRYSSKASYKAKKFDILKGKMGLITEKQMNRF